MLKIRYALLLCGFMCVAAALSSATKEEVLADVDRLVGEKKYLSAFELLKAQENGDSDPDIALKKTELAFKCSDNPEAAGNALYHLSVFYMHTGDGAAALKTLDEAESNFRKVLKEDHPVFKAIEEIHRKAGAPSGPAR